MADRLHEFKVRLGLRHEDVYVEMDGRRLNAVTSLSIEAAADDQRGKITLTMFGLIEADVTFTEGQVVKAERAIWDFDEYRAGKPDPDKSP